jgi:hypothetical protein
MHSAIPAMHGQMHRCGFAGASAQHYDPGGIQSGATAMNEDALNNSMRKFLKTVGVTSQREIEKAIREAVAAGRIKGNESLSAQMVLTIGGVGLNHKIDGTIDLN